MLLPNRAIVAVAGEDRVSFLQGLVTNDVTLASTTRAVYSCLLTAQGRFLHDFFVVAEGERLLLDCEADRREHLMRRLKQFRLRAKVEVTDEADEYRIHHSASPQPGMLCVPDPRHAELGYRYVLSSGALLADEGIWQDYDRRRIALAIPDGSRDMVPEQALLLENNLERLNGIAWNKGCYVGQELTARMHHRGGAKKRLMAVTIEGPIPEPGTPVTSAGNEVGTMRSSCGDLGLALLRVDAAGILFCGEATLRIRV